MSNWGKWGPDDELGTLNYITPDHIAHASSLVSSGKTFSLGVAYDAYGPQGAHGFRRNPIHLMTLDGGDIDMIARLGSWGRETEAMISWIWQGPMRFNDDFIMMPLQAATQWDALSHVYYEQKFYNGYDASTCTSMGATKGSIDKPAAAGKVAARGVLLDVAKFKGVDRLEETGDHHCRRIWTRPRPRKGSRSVRVMSCSCVPGTGPGSSRPATVSTAGSVRRA